MRICKFCEKVIKGKYSNKYCDQKCFELGIIKNSDEKYFLGLITEQKTVKKAYLRHNPEICACCGIGKEWNEKPLVLQLDHIDGNSDNNFPDNLRLLCPNCHTQTDTFCSKQVQNSEPKQRRRNSYLQIENK